jgi:hypothetical protein
MAIKYGLYKDLGDEIVYVPVKQSETWSSGSFVDLDASGDAEACDADDVPFGVSADTITTADAPAADGAIKRAVYVGGNNWYVFPPDTGTVTNAIVGKLMDVGGAQSVNIDQSTQNSLRCVGVDLAENLVYVVLNTSAVAGV